MNISLVSSGLLGFGGARPGAYKLVDKGMRQTRSNCYAISFSPLELPLHSLGSH